MHSTGPNQKPGNPSARSATRAVFLVGFMGAGKTSVGRALAKSVGWEFEDLDDRIQAREGRTIPQIFAERGETGFRRAESDALKAVLDELGRQPRVVALGGGAYAQAGNAALLAAAGVPTVFLDAAPEELYRRCQMESVDRPLRRDEAQFLRLYQDRRPFYLKAGVRIETNGRSIEAIAAEVAQRLQLDSRRGE